ncbi:MAG: hypothetical protein HW405_24 [Candidatus Berkelbacteria bacterium]|nr:hypothetical protein [Candidatus Berkelbacteria bacterium]
MKDIETKNEGTSFCTGLVIIIVISYFIIKWIAGGVDNFNAKWMGTFYPVRYDLTRYTLSPEFKSIEECRDWVEGQTALYNRAEGYYDYECGKNCKYHKDTNIYVCEESIH